MGKGEAYRFPSRNAASFASGWIEGQSEYSGYEVFVEKAFPFIFPEERDV
jgi:hypothetical protein